MHTDMLPTYMNTQMCSHMHTHVHYTFMLTYTDSSTHTRTRSHAHTLTPTHTRVQRRAAGKGIFADSELEQVWRGPLDPCSPCVLSWEGALAGPPAAPTQAVPHSKASSPCGP